MKFTLILNNNNNKTRNEKKKCHPDLMFCLLHLLFTTTITSTLNIITIINKGFSQGSFFGRHTCTIDAKSNGPKKILCIYFFFLSLSLKKNRVGGGEGVRL